MHEVNCANGMRKMTCEVYLSKPALTRHPQVCSRNYLPDAAFLQPPLQLCKPLRNPLNSCGNSTHSSSPHFTFKCAFFASANMSFSHPNIVHVSSRGLQPRQQTTLSWPPTEALLETVVPDPLFKSHATSRQLTNSRPSISTSLLPTNRPEIFPASSPCSASPRHDLLRLALGPNLILHPILGLISFTLPLVFLFVHLHLSRFQNLLRLLRPFLQVRHDVLPCLLPRKSSVCFLVDP